MVVGAGAAATNVWVACGAESDVVSLNVTSAATMTAIAHNSATPNTTAVFLAPAFTSASDGATAGSFPGSEVVDARPTVSALLGVSSSSFSVRSCAGGAVAGSGPYSICAAQASSDSAMTVLDDFSVNHRHRLPRRR